MQSLRFILFFAIMPFATAVSAQDVVIKSIEPLVAINSPAEELMAVLDNGGGTLFFTRVGHENNVGGRGAGSDIWGLFFSENANAKPINDFDYWNNRENNALVGFNADGTTVYLLNGYGKQEGIAFSRRLHGTWTKPEVVPIPGLSDFGFKSFYMSPDFNYLLISMTATDALGEEDLYVSVKQPNGKWAKPKNLGNSINTKGFEISPFLTADGKTLFFASNGHEGYGNADIFMAQRLYDSWDVWSTPVNLGAQINSIGFDAYFSYYDSLAFLSSNRGGGLSDIYKVTFDGIGLTAGAGANSNNQILTEPEIVNLFGFIFDPQIDFEKGTDSLSAKDRELLWFIADKLSKQPEVRIGLYQQGGDGPKRKRKFHAIISYLNELKFPAEQIVSQPGSLTPTNIKANNQELVQLIFFKLK